MKNVYLMIVAFLLFLSCDNDGKSSITMQKSIGQCGETWDDTFIQHQGEGDIFTASSLLNNLGIDFMNISVEELDNPVICGFCQDCPTGKFYVIKFTLENDENEDDFIERMKVFGFVVN